MPRKLTPTLIITPTNNAAPGAGGVASGSFDWAEAALLVVLFLQPANRRGNHLP